MSRQPNAGDLSSHSHVRIVSLRVRFKETLIFGIGLAVSMLIVGILLTIIAIPFLWLIGALDRWLG